VDAGASYDEAGLPIRPRPDGSDIRLAAPEERRLVAEALSHGFYDDPLFRWMFPDDSRRLREGELGFDLFVRHFYFPHGEIYTTDRFAGAACWIAPHRSKVGILKQLRMLPGMVRVFRGDLPRLFAMVNAFDKRHPHEDAHWYLPAIAVRSAWQGRGFGAALLRPALERCDREGIPAYLEATSPRNRALYERHGFEVRDELRVREDAPPTWLMWRDPV
jgi:GNAT superfamily N-acetyltransferase